MDRQGDETLKDEIAARAFRLFRGQCSHEAVSRCEKDLLRRISYISALVQSEKVAPPEGWDPLGR